jgi:hypothetical protein
LPTNPDQIDDRHRQIIGSIVSTVMPIYETDSSEELKPHIGQIVELCVRVVSEDPRTLAFVRDLHGTATRGGLAEWAASSDGDLLGTGWSQLHAALDAAFPGVDLTPDEQ